MIALAPLRKVESGNPAASCIRGNTGPTRRSLLDRGDRLSCPVVLGHSVRFPWSLKPVDPDKRENIKESRPWPRFCSATVLAELGLAWEIKKIQDVKEGRMLSRSIALRIGFPGYPQRCRSALNIEASLKDYPENLHLVAFKLER